MYFYVNNVIVNVDHEALNKDPDLGKLIKGEAYAVSWFLHFEVMRLFCDITERIRRREEFLMPIRLI